MLNVVYENDKLLAVNKPIGQTVIAGRNIDNSLVLINEVEQYLGSKAWIVHRIDRESSGIVIFAKDRSTHRNLCTQFEHRMVHKKYLAVVHGIMEKPSGHIDEPIRQFGSGRMGVDHRGKPSLTTYQILKRLRSSTLLEVSPISGRRHQIRVHFYYMGHPLLGEMLYGKERPVGGIERLMLHALEICFETQEGEKITIKAEPDSQWNQIIDRLASL